MGSGWILKSDGKWAPSPDPLLRPSLSSLLVTSTDSIWLQIVRPTRCYQPFRSKIKILSIVDVESLDILFQNDMLLAVDIETRGLNPLQEDSRIVGIGVAGKDSIVYFDMTECNPDQVYRWLGSISDRGAELVGHNVFFDSSWLKHFMKRNLNWRYDTFSIYRQLASEGYNQLRYGLKDAQLDLLKWSTKGDVELDEWLASNGYYKGARRVIHGDSTALLEEYRAGKLTVDKGEMWRAPPAILGYYCGLDVVSTYQLLTQVFIPSTEPHSWCQAFWNYHEVFMDNLAALVESRLGGFRIDTSLMDEYWKKISEEVTTASQEFFTNSEIGPLIKEFNASRLEEFTRENEPSRFKKPPLLGIEPARVTKNGKESRAWQSWHDKKEKIENWEKDENNVSISWKNWQVKATKLQERGAFNLDSSFHRSWLFYDKLGYSPTTFTDTGKAAVDKKALRTFGVHGALLKHYNDLTKEQQMATSCRQAMIEHEESGWRIHPEYKCPGTFTGRLAGSGGLNVQQLPKRRDYLSCWIPDPGKVIVDVDWSAIEMVVLAGLSRDESLWRLYGPEAVPNDPYLYNGASIKGLKEAILAAGYDPLAPTPAGIAAAKKLAKKERGISKIITLGAGYGMGPKKLKLTLGLEGIVISDDEAYQMYKGYWDLYSGVKKYGYKLEKEWAKNNGWIVNLVGRPICCAEFFKKDLINRMVQSSAHDIHQLFIQELQLAREKSQVEFEWLIPDFHDQSIVQVPVEQGPAMIQLYREAAARVNSRIRQLSPGFDMELKIDPQIVNNLADAKIPKE